MSDIGSDPTRIDYTLADELAADTPERMKALGDPLRFAIADLVLERAMSVTDLAERLDRPKGTIAYHVDVLVDAGLLTVVRTRRVRAMEERFYGRTARTFVMHKEAGEIPFLHEVVDHADLDDDAGPRGFALRRARIPTARIDDYIARIHALALEFSEEPRAGDTEYAIYLGVFPTTRRIAPGTGRP
jgi:DNA-binding transcriptional ArsR family regulator